MYIVISALSGTGKTSVIQGIMSKLPQFRLAVSATTRSPRLSEVEGKDYYFVDEKTFDEKLLDGKFLESKLLFGNLYGTLHSEFQKENVIFDVDIHGLKAIKNFYPQAYCIVIIPPSLQHLSDRLRKRNEPQSQIELRTCNNEEKLLELVNNCHYVVVNYSLSETIDNILSIIQFQGS